MQNVLGCDGLSPVETKKMILNLEISLKQCITWEMRVRIRAQGRFNGTQENLELCKSWGISENILCCSLQNECSCCNIETVLYWFGCVSFGWYIYI
jgi:hypothetical protein